MKKGLIIFFVLWILWVSTWMLIRIQIKGDKVVSLALGEKYEEQGATASFLGNELMVDVQGKVNSSEMGEYIITYCTRNFVGIKKTKKRTVVVGDTIKPQIKLKGSLKMTIAVGDNYLEPGFTVTDNHDKKVKVNVTQSIDSEKPGVYEVIYQAEDQAGNQSVVKRLVEVKERYFSYLSSYDVLDNEMRGWWSNNKFDHKRPTGGYDEKSLLQYDTYYMGSDERTIYLTFDEGSSDTYLNEIAKTLYDEGVQATFFLCGNYMVSHADQVKNWVKWGHSIGNHTYHHREMSKYANEAGLKVFQEEIRTMEDNYYKITGKKMDKIFRFPKGEYSLRGLQIVKDMGYKTFFWSADYLDFDQDYAKDYVYAKLMDRHHNGAIYLLHPKNKGNYEVLPDFIREMKKMGYQFGLVKDISYSK